MQGREGEGESEEGTGLGLDGGHGVGEKGWGCWRAAQKGESAALAGSAEEREWKGLPAAGGVEGEAREK